VSDGVVLHRTNLQGFDFSGVRLDHADLLALLDGGTFKLSQDDGRITNADDSNRATPKNSRIGRYCAATDAMAFSGRTRPEGRRLTGAV